MTLLDTLDIFESLAIILHPAVLSSKNNEVASYKLQVQQHVDGGVVNAMTHYLTPRSVISSKSCKQQYVGGGAIANLKLYSTT